MLAVLVLVVTVYGLVQEAQPSRDRVVRELQSQRVKVDDVVLSKDAATIHAALGGQLRQPLDRLKLDPGGELDAVGWAWALARQPGPRAKVYQTWEPVRLSDVVAVASSLGKLVVESDPTDGAVTVDDYKWPQNTQATGFAEVGARRVVVRKGNAEAATVCQISADRVMTVVANLNDGTARCQQR